MNIQGIGMVYGTSEPVHVLRIVYTKECRLSRLTFEGGINEYLARWAYV
jgi:hypothetical protein